MPLVAGVDSSTQSCKVVIHDAESGELVRSGSAKHPPGTEVDPEAWWTALLEAVDAAGGLGDVSALSVGGQQHGMVCLDAEGRVIRPALLWNDTRSAPDATDLVRELGDGDPDVGAQRWARAVGSVPVASITVTKLRWLARNEPENAARVAAVALPHDWLTWRLSGAASLETLATDRSDASGTGYFDAVTNTYRRDLLALGLLRSEAEVASVVLPKVAGPAEPVGHGDPQRGWGDIVLGPGCGDNAGAALGLGLGVDGACLSIGTSGVDLVGVRGADGRRLRPGHRVRRRHGTVPSPRLHAQRLPRPGRHVRGPRRRPRRAERARPLRRARVGRGDARPLPRGGTHPQPPHRHRRRSSA